MEIQNKKKPAKDKLEFVSSIITDKRGKILVLKRREDLKLDPGKYDFCSGHIKEGEGPIQAMYREMKEELGISFEQITNLSYLCTIKTPHEKFRQTLTHIYNVNVNLDKELDEMITKVDTPEMQEIMRIDSIEELIKMIDKQDNNSRMMMTYELEAILKALQQKLNKRKDEDLRTCEER